MAERLAANGPLAVFNRSQGPRERLAAAGAMTFGEADDFFEASDCVLLMLADDAAVNAVLDRGGSGFRRRVAGRLIVNMGTHAPDWSERLAVEVQAAGGRYVEAPVSGSAGSAAKGELAIMLAGEPDDVASVMPLLEPLGATRLSLEAVPQALACKLAVNLFLIASMAALAEATDLARRSGVDLATFAQVIGTGPLGSPVTRAKLVKMIENDFAPEAAIADVCKNAALVADAAADAGTPARLLAIARERFDAIRRNNGDRLDMAAVIGALNMERLT